MAVKNIITFNFNFNPNFFKLIITLIPTLILIIIVLMELLWAEKIIKYSNRIIAAIAIKKELGAYICARGVYKLYLIDRILGRIL